MGTRPPRVEALIPPGSGLRYAASMKKFFYAGLAGLALFEILQVYFIMPMPGSQGLESAGVAYFLHTWRWGFRVLFFLMIVAGARTAFGIRCRWLPAAALLLAMLVAWVFNFRLTAESMFRQPQILSVAPRERSAVEENSVVIGVERNGEAKAYPIRFLVYHHQVPDSVGGMPVLVTYCSVCRTGRVFDPTVNGKPETFRLVGMDHFNAIFEDRATGSWWRQATGEAIVGPLKGTTLPEIPFEQRTVREWLALHPHGLIMQPDPTSLDGYDSHGAFERGESTSALTGTDHGSWNDKSWVVGIDVAGAAKAYDWNRLKDARVINDRIGGTPIVLALATDQQSFSAFERPDGSATFTMDDNVLSSAGHAYDLAGRDLADPQRYLKKLRASQEFWHSWRTFHPGTSQNR